jgi:hypothetical protein
LEVQKSNATDLRLSSGTSEHFMSIGNANDATYKYWYFTLGAATTDEYVFYNRQGGDARGIAARNNGGNWHRVSLYHNDVFGAVQTSGSTPLVLQPSSGNVGIGTTSPTTRFQVSAGRATFRASNEEWAIGVAYNDAQYPTDSFFLGVTTNGGSAGTGMFKISNAAGAHRFAVLNNGDVAAAGAVYGTVKYFQIPHPVDPAKLLTHASLEGPEAGVYYRGEAQLAKGEVEVILPPYFEALTRKEGRTVQLTPVEGWSPLFVVKGIQAGKFLVRTAAQGDPAQRFYWEVKAVRADVGPLAIEAERSATAVPFPRP